jgi:Na+-transporting methylmalonyl-CoA/oxaloacetate decarboxylase gamma subunit
MVGKADYEELVAIISSCTHVVIFLYFIFIVISHMRECSTNVAINKVSPPSKKNSLVERDEEDHHDHTAVTIVP